MMTKVMKKKAKGGGANVRWRAESIRTNPGLLHLAHGVDGL